MRLPERLSPGADGTATGAGTDTIGQRRPANYNPVDTLLSRLDKVKSTGTDKWLACCPSHDDRSPSLSIRESSDGTVLLHCFGGCGAAEVVHAVGLELKDLFPYDPHYHAAPRKRRIPPLDALIAIDFEALLVSTVAGDIINGRGIDRETRDRLTTAVARIGAAREAYR